jgi:hypothetical protein
MQWTDVVTALSTALIALLLALPALASFILLRELRRAVKSLEGFASTLQKDIVPAVQQARTMVEEATQVAGSVKGEVQAIVATSTELRGKVKQAANAVEVRLTDLETLLDMVYDEVEDTALDVAAALRTTRRGAGIFSAMKRAILRRGR